MRISISVFSVKIIGNIMDDLRVSAFDLFSILPLSKNIRSAHDVRSVEHSASSSRERSAQLEINLINAAAMIPKGRGRERGV